jgi:hypothetical protein
MELAMPYILSWYVMDGLFNYRQKAEGITSVQTDDAKRIICIFTL